MIGDAGDLISSLVERGTLVAVVVVMTIVAAVVIGRRRWPQQLTGPRIALLASTLVVIAVTQIPPGGSSDLAGVHWSAAPGRAIRWPFESDAGAGWFVTGWWLNVLLFVPIGSAAAAATRSTRTAVVVGLAVSFAVETMQAITGLRASDIVDLAANTTGAAVGAVAWMAFGRPLGERWSSMTVLWRRVVVVSMPIVLVGLIVAAVWIDASRTQSALHDELWRRYGATTLAEQRQTFFPDDPERSLEFDAFLAASSVRPDSVVRQADGQRVEVRYAIRVFGFDRCVMVVWTPADVELIDRSGAVCIRFLG